MAIKSPHQPQPLVKPIHFFKIITPQSLHHGKLMFPERFVEKYGEGLPNSLFLKTPNGAEWKFNLEKRNGKIWFEKGWKEFAEYHSLAHGHLLVFRCQRTSLFQVHIFDLSASEIDYPPRRKQGKTVSNNHGNRPPIVKILELECHRSGQKRKDNSAVECIQPYQLRSRKSVKVDYNLILPKEALHHTGRKGRVKSGATVNQITALDRASSFKPSNPFFLVVMHPSYVGSYNLSLPSEFCKRHFDLRKHRLINLQELNGRVWPAKLVVHKNRMNTVFKFSGAWKEFGEHNNLKVGDVCIFELVHRTKLTFLVHIFRETDSSNCSTCQESSEMRAACHVQRKEMKTITATK
ncbi:B3 domain-containing transcription factor VRN1 [Cajanus cajan]|uniref:B3 domain-containing transcription factor VRN1 n=1 Tax=Cajanus cajan TaxID=3821 RepID=UPI00098D9FB6|nr:B3 domain-containing transcription factor VRN1 [Cajanus cajan]